MENKGFLVNLKTSQMSYRFPLHSNTYVMGLCYDHLRAERVKVKKKSYVSIVSNNNNFSLRDSTRFWNLLRGMN